MALIEEHTKVDITGQMHTAELHKDDQGRWSVAMWSGRDENNLDLAWQVYGVVTGYVDGNPNRPIRTPFTEETARAEFERWRT